jgi:hypothetical protein
MALFMDSHAIDGGVKASDVAQAHLADLRTQDRYGSAISAIGLTSGREGSSA